MVAAALLWLACASAAAAAPARILAFGDSLTAGYGLAPNEAFPARLQARLADAGVAAQVINGGVSGDTTAGGLSRLDWALGDRPDLVLVELGANDALRGIDPAVTRRALDGILRALAGRKIPVLLCGMLSPPNLGSDYARTFDAIFPELAKAHGVVFYPFFLDGVAADPKLNQRDGLHPTAAGVDVIVAKILPKVEELLARAKAGTEAKRSTEPKTR
jgi:acyl-CoA thioesterase-1